MTQRPDATHNPVVSKPTLDPVGAGDGGVEAGAGSDVGADVGEGLERHAGTSKPDSVEKLVTDNTPESCGVMVHDSLLP